jgi:hypothetical protein
MCDLNILGTRTEASILSSRNLGVTIVLATVKQSACLTLGILKSLYPLADFNVVGDGSDLVSTLCSY